VAHAANRVLSPTHTAVQPPTGNRPPVLPFGPSAPEVRAFLDGEAANLPAVVRYATEHGRYRAAWHLAYLLAGFFDLSGHIGEALLTTRWGLDGARRDGDRDGQRIMHATHAAMCNNARRPRDAVYHLRRVIELARADGLTLSEANAYNNLGRALRQLGRTDEAVEAYHRALALDTERPHHIAMAHNNLSGAYLRLGDLDAAAEHITLALHGFTSLGDRSGRARCQTTLADLQLRKGEVAAAVAGCRAAVAVAREIGNRDIELQAVRGLARALSDGGDHDGALHVLEQALPVCRETAATHHEALILGTIGGVQLERDDLRAAERSLHAAHRLIGVVPDPSDRAAIEDALRRLESRSGRDRYAVPTGAVTP
jgi:tetratricopeptide (TPR) repeat protein